MYIHIYIYKYMSVHRFVYVCVVVGAAIAASAEKLVVPGERNGACLDCESLGSGDSRD